MDDSERRTGETDLRSARVLQETGAGCLLTATGRIRPCLQQAVEHRIAAVSLVRQRWVNLPIGADDVLGAGRELVELRRIARHQPGEGQPHLSRPRVAVRLLPQGLPGPGGVALRPELR